MYYQFYVILLKFIFISQQYSLLIYISEFLKNSFKK